MEFSRIGVKKNWMQIFQMLMYTYFGPFLLMETRNKKNIFENKKKFRKQQHQDNNYRNHENKY